LKVYDFVPLTLTLSLKGRGNERVPFLLPSPLEGEGLGVRGF